MIIGFNTRVVCINRDNILKFNYSCNYNYNVKCNYKNIINVNCNYNINMIYFICM